MIPNTNIYRYILDKAHCGQSFFCLLSMTVTDRFEVIWRLMSFRVGFQNSPNSHIRTMTGILLFISIISSTQRASQTMDQQFGKSRTEWQSLLVFISLILTNMNSDLTTNETCEISILSARFEYWKWSSQCHRGLLNWRWPFWSLSDGQTMLYEPHWLEWKLWTVLSPSGYQRSLFCTMLTYGRASDWTNPVRSRFSCCIYPMPVQNNGNML